MYFCSYGQTKTSCVISSGSPCLPSRVYSYTLFGLIYCICLLCDWSFHLYENICYFLASYLFVLWHFKLLWSCFELLPGKISFLFKGFSFLAMTKFSRVRFQMFVAWNFHTVIFLLFLFTCYFSSFDACVVCIVYGSCYPSSFGLFI